MPLSQTGSYS
ncbi:hypothetical protein F383_10814 [Gossypium arboreum]|uniref:Uncharacterized protein n=1 Tax=Gossypium arboreum TaxID=29729 RepID=A0A0B0PWC6_GOSAR|nr:hypothetical protein F383_10814 [Gossypium arboreum]